jgi:hypothetical protein
MMVESPPASGLKITQADFLFEILIAAFNTLPKLCCSCQLFKRNGCIKVDGFVKSYFPLPWWEGIKGRVKVT